MGTVYYLRNKKKYNEISSFKSFLETSLNKLKKDIEEYCDKANGVIINSDYAEDICKSLPSIYSLVSEDRYDIDIGAFGRSGFIFRNEYVEEEEIILNSLESLKEILNGTNGNGYCIIDDYNKEISLKEFIAMINT